MAEAGQQNTDKSQKREARLVREAARQAFAAGDFSRARQLNAKVLLLAPDSDVGREAAVEAENLRTDPMAIYIGLASLALYGLAWVYALS